MFCSYPGKISWSLKGSRVANALRGLELETGGASAFQQASPFVHRQFGHHVHRGFCFPFVGDAQGLHWQYLPTFVLVTTLHRCAQRFCCFFALGLRINIERTSKLPAKEIRRVGVLLRSFFFCDHLEPPTDSYSRVIFSDHWEPRQIFRIQLRRIERKWVQTARRLIHALSGRLRSLSSNYTY